MLLLVVNEAQQQRTVIVVVLEPENMERMRAADPATLESTNSGGLLRPPLFPLNTSLLVAYEEDKPTLYALAKNGDADEIIRYLERGRKWDPETDGRDKAVDLTA